MRQTIPLAVLAFALATFSQPAAADLGGGASIGKGEICYGQIPDANGLLLGDTITTTDSQVVSNKAGNVSLTCHFYLTPEQTPAKSVRASSFECNVGGRLTNDSVMSATPGGSAKLVCKVNKKTP